MTPVPAPATLSWLESPAAREWARTTLSPSSDPPPLAGSQEHLCLQEKLAECLGRVEVTRQSGNTDLIEELGNEVAKTRVLLAPIRRFPVEILHIVIGFTGQAEYPKEPGISLVSTAWRDVALATPYIWSNVVITNTDFSWKRFKNWTARAGVEPLSLRVRSDYNVQREWFESIAGWLQHQLKRLRILECCSIVGHLSVYGDLLQSPWLTELVIAVPKYYGDSGLFPHFPITNEKRCMSELKTLHLKTYPLRGLPFFTAPSLSNLKLEYADIDARQFLAILQESCCLEVVEIKRVRWYHLDSIDLQSPLSLKLKMLRYWHGSLRDLDMFTLLISNSLHLRHLSVGSYQEQFDLPDAVVPPPSLEVVDLNLAALLNSDIPPSSHRLERVFKFTNLRRLSLSSRASTSNFPEPEMLDLVQFLSHLSGLGYMKCPLPELENLKLEDWQVDLNALRQFLQTRQTNVMDHDAETPVGGCTISLFGCSLFPDFQQSVIPDMENASFQDFEERWPSVSPESNTECTPVALQ